MRQTTLDNLTILALVFVFGGAGCLNWRVPNEDASIEAGSGDVVNADATPTDSNAPETDAQLVDADDPIDSELSEVDIDGDHRTEDDGNDDASETDPSGDSETCQCSGGPCCDGCFYYGTERLCSTTTEFGCGEDGCGADARWREVTQHCSGSSELCDGSTTWGEWLVIEECHIDEICEADAEGASCALCSNGCEHGECIGDPRLDWREITGTMPPPRYWPDMAFDSSRNVVVLFGGYGVDRYWDDTWEYDENGWTRVTLSTHPPPSFHHAMVYDSTREVIVLFGDSFADSDVTWEYDGETWTMADPAESPPGRSSPAMSYDSLRGVVVLIGGEGAGNEPLNDTWEYNGVTWVEALPDTSPSRRYGSAMAFDSNRGVSVLFGGSAGSRETWEWVGDEWTNVSTEPAPNTSNTEMVYDSDRQIIVLVTQYGTTWEFNGTMWVEAATSSSPPSRWGFAVAFDSARSLTVLYGGFDSYRLDDTWELGIW